MIEARQKDSEDVAFCVDNVVDCWGDCVMGCLIELFLELFVEAVLEGWVALCQWIVPEKSLGPKTRRVLKIIAGTVSVLYLLSVCIGLSMLLDDEEFVRTIGKNMVFLPLILSGAQILFGIIVKIIEKRK